MRLMRLMRLIVPGAYRIANSSEQCAAEDAVIADLAVAPYPLGPVKPSSKRLKEGAA